MKRYFVYTCLATLFCAAGRAAVRPAAVDVIVGPKAPQLERLAAEELSTYVERVFIARAAVTRIEARDSDFVFLVGSPLTNPAIASLSPKPFRTAGDQTILSLPVRWQGRRALIVGGRSPRATYWAVSRLAETWGVRHLLAGDRFPERRAFRIDPVESIASPDFSIRGWRVINDFAYGFESWGMRDYRPLLHQLAKLTFNRLFVAIYPWQPFLDLKTGGIKRTSATLWYGFRYPITPDMIGRSLFGATTEFWNPDLPPHGSYQAMAAAGQELVQSIVAEGHRFGMECVLSATLTSFPPEFAPLLKSHRTLTQLGGMDIVPGPDTAIDDPSLQNLAAAVLRNSVDTYPDVDALSVAMPEHRDWVEHYDDAWRTLDLHYGVEKARPLREILKAAANRPNYPGGPERAVREVKGDIAALYFLDLLQNRTRSLQGSRRPDMPLVLVGLAEELQPIAGRVLHPKSELMAFVDYTPARVLQRRQALRRPEGAGIGSTLIYTLEDDNVGLLPQLTTNSIAELNGELRANGWNGFVTRCWLVGDREPAMAYLARSSWNRELGREDAYRDYLKSVCGTTCVEPMLRAFGHVEAATLGLGWHGLGFAFPIPDMLLKNWKPAPLAPELEAAGAHYREALKAIEFLHPQGPGAGSSEVAYWKGRLGFAVEYFKTIEALSSGAQADAAGNRSRAAASLQDALGALTRGVAAYAAVARDQSDRGAIAILNEYAVRPLRAKTAQYGVR
ncbi:MAG: hypothetical protein U0Q18_03890 [Bryobacteraceae bacterium]